MYFYLTTQVCFAAKQALIRALRPKIRRQRQRAFVPSPPRRSSPPPAQPQAPAAASQRAASQNQGEFSWAPPGQGQQGQQQGGAGGINIGPGGIPLGGIAGNLDALVMPAGAEDGPGGGGAVPPNLPNVLDALAGDVDDEAMVELAIALSLQERLSDQKSIQENRK